MNEQYLKDAGIVPAPAERKVSMDTLENMTVFNASLELIKKSEQAVNRIKKDMDDCAAFMESETLNPCPKCNKSEDVHLIYAKQDFNAPTCHGLIIECRACELQTKAQYWHESATESTLTALRHVYESWGSTTNTDEAS